MALSRKPLGIGHMYIYTLLLRMTDTITYQNIYISSWDILYIYIYIYIYPLWYFAEVSEQFEVWTLHKGKGKGMPRQAEVALGVPGRLRPRIFSTFGTTRVVERQPNVPAAFTPGEIPGTHFEKLSRPQGTWFCRKEPRKKSEVTPPGIDRMIHKKADILRKI